MQCADQSIVKILEPIAQVQQFTVMLTIQPDGKCVECEIPPVQVFFNTSHPHAWQCSRGFIAFRTGTDEVQGKALWGFPIGGEKLWMDCQLPAMLRAYLFPKPDRVSFDNNVKIHHRLILQQIPDDTANNKNRHVQVFGSICGNFDQFQLLGGNL